MTWLLLGILLFVGVHSTSIFAQGWRKRMVRRMGDGPWKALYGLVSLAGLVLIVYGYGAARLDPVFLYVPPAWMRHVAFLLLLPVFPLLLAAYLPGRIRTRLGHPMLAAVKFWALAHLLVNGTLADVILFGGFLTWAVVDRISFKRRSPRAVPALPASGWNDAIAVVGGLGLYVAFALWLHPLLIGVAVVG